MKISRKMQQQVELKIRHAMATGSLPHVERVSAITGRHRHESGKSEGYDTNHAK